MNPDLTTGHPHAAGCALVQPHAAGSAEAGSAPTEDPSGGPAPRSTRLVATGAVGVALLVHVLLLAVLGLVVVFRAPEPTVSIVAVSGTEHAIRPMEKRILEVPTKQKPSRSSAAAIPTLTATARAAISLPVTVEESITENPFGTMGDGLGDGLGAMFGGGGKTAGEGFFGLKTDEDRIVFVVDVSGSMSSGADGADNYFRVEDELVKSLRALKPTTFVNVIVFGSDTRSYRSRLVQAEPDEIEELTAWAQRRGPVRRVEGNSGIRVVRSNDDIHGGTRADIGLTEAFRDDPEMIVFLSDGSPTGMGEEEIHQLVAKLQEKRTEPAVINTISYRSESGKEFMQRLATDSSGTYKHVQ